MVQEEQRQQQVDENNMTTWDPPLVHVDSGIQFSNHRMMMELPLQNEPR
jgi:hypothetical protein